MNLLFEIADRDLLFIFLGVVALIILGIIILYIVTKDKKVMTVAEEEHFDEKPVKEVTKELTEEQKQAKEEIERVFNIMSADLENSNDVPSVIDEFEREQEENAIISYQELIKQAKSKGQIINEDFVEEDSPSEPDYEPTHTKYEIYEETSIKEKKHTYKVPVSEATEGDKKFKNSEFISPIFGIQGNNTSYPAVKKLEKEKRETKKDYETDANAQFLKSLKEFRENL